MNNAAQTDLYQRLQDFELDDPTHEFGFTRHLMKSQAQSHHWQSLCTSDPEVAATEIRSIVMLLAMWRRQWFSSI